MPYHINFYGDDSSFDAPLCKFFIILVIITIGLTVSHLIAILMKFPVTNRITIFLAAALTVYVSKNLIPTIFFNCNFDSVTAYPMEYYIYYMSVYLLRAVFVININKLRKVLLSGILISISTAFIPLIYSYFFFYYYKLERSIVRCVLFSCTFSGIHPFFMQNSFRETHGYVYAKQLIEIEAIMLSQLSVFYFEKTLELDSNFVNKIPLYFLLSILSIIFGTILGGVVSFLLIHINFNSVTTVLFLLSYSIVCNSFVHYFYMESTLIAFSGLVVVMFQKDKFLPQNEKFISYTIEVIYEGVYLVTYASSLFYLLSKVGNININDSPIYLITFLFFLGARSTILLCLLPIIRKINPFIPTRSIIILIFVPLFDNFSLFRIIVLTQLNQTTELSTYFLSHLLFTMISSTTLSTMGITIYIKFCKLYIKESSELLNMARSQQYILKEKADFIMRMKMNRVYGDVNWTTVWKQTDLQLPYPYPKEIDLTTSKNAKDFGAAYLCCNPCPNPPRNVGIASKKLRSIKTTFKIDILVEMRRILIRQYHDCLITKKCADFLTGLLDKHLNLETASHHIKIQDLEILYKKNEFLEKTAKFCSKLKSKNRTIVLMPRNPCRRCCYRILHNFTFHLFIDFLILLVVVHVLLNLTTSFDENYKIEELTFCLSNVIFFVFLCEFIITVMALWWVYLCRDGFGTYFKSLWRVFDFIALVSFGLLLSFNWTERFYGNDFLAPKYMIVTKKVMLALSIIRVIRILKSVFYLILMVIKSLEKRVDKRIAFGYEVTKALKECYDEILLSNDLLLEQNELLKNFRATFERDRLELNNIMTRIQIERPWISTSIKTRQLICANNCRMKESINYLRRSGFLDTSEYLGMLKFINCQRKMETLKKIQRITPKEMFKQMTWIVLSTDIENYLFKNATILDFKVGTFIAKPNKTLDGVYIIISGNLKVIYEPDEIKIQGFMENGFLPIIPYFDSKDFETPTEFYLNNGNCIGVLSLLTGRPMDCSIKCETTVKLFFIKKCFLIEAFTMGESTCYKSLETELWKYAVVHMVVTILSMEMTKPPKSMKDMLLFLQRGFVPEIKGYNSLVITEKIEDVILVEGIVINYYTGELYYGPCYLPRGVGKINIVRVGPTNEAININTKVMIIPVIDVTPKDIMDVEDILADLTPSRRHELRVIRRNLKRNTIDSTSLQS